VAAVGFGNMLHENIFPFRIIENRYADNVYISAFLVAFIPVLSIILLIIKGIFKTATIGRSTGTVFLAVWLCALTVLVYYAAIITAGFRDSARFTETVNLKATKNNTYYLKLNDIKYFSHEDSVKLDIKNRFHNMVVIDDNSNGFHDEPRSVTLYIEKSDINQPVLEESYHANGSNYEEALFNARNTSYIFAQQDTLLKFDYSLRKRPNRSWHGEEVFLTLRLPLNSKVVIDQKLDNYVQGVSLYDCHDQNKEDNTTNYSVFTMTNNGLQCKVDSVLKTKRDSVKNADSTQTAE